MARVIPLTTRGAPRRYELHVVLVDVEPPIWRDLEVDSDVRLGRLHGILQTTMGWQNSHLHLFHLEGQRIAGPPDDEMEAEDERKIRLHDVAPSEGTELNYEYDFGDSWMHRLTVTAIRPGGPDGPKCRGGERHCPPEDCGGPDGYRDLLNVLGNPKHPEYYELRDWVGAFDAESFDVDSVNRRLHRAKR